MIYYHNPKCSKSREGLKLLQSKKVSFQIKEYLKEPLSKEELKELFQKLVLNPKDVVRKKEQKFKELNLDEKSLNIDQWIEILQNHPILLERPILMSSQKAIIGRPTEKLLEILP